MTRPLVFLISFLAMIGLHKGEVWKKDVSSVMEIGLSTTGYESVDLRCDAEHFSVNVTLKNDFEGIVYTRGSHGEKNPPCFKRHHQNVYRGDDKLTISMKIPFNKCLTVMDVAESCYSNTVVVQHDPELIMPGDAAFLLQCSFEPEFKVSSDLTTTTKPSFKSKVSLVNADPAGKTDLTKNDFSVSSDTERVSFLSNSTKSQAKDEL